jgi:hypothetical protein
MRKHTPRKLKLTRETVRVLSDRQLPAAAGGTREIAVGGDTRPVSDTCLCTPTYWETCQG